jgi:altronate dehydratase small subunit
LAANSPNDPRLLRLHPSDNVLTVIAALAAGDEIAIGEAKARVPVALAIGHKVAAEAIPAGAKIVKYGAPIGSAMRNIAAGEHVHTHNLQSDYLPTFLREDQGKYFAAGRTAGVSSVSAEDTGGPPVVRTL